MNQKWNQTGELIKSDIRLSISILSSGRESGIERCLQSLQIIKDSIPTEIVIVDTDSTHDKKVRKILRKYADRIIDFEWCDDFSKARNAGMKECSGEWFMFIDDDEWFIDADPVIDFLRSKDREKYRWLNFHVRNFTNTGLTEFFDHWVTRIVRMRTDLRFEGRIHEYFYPLEGDALAIGAVVGHSGYVYSTPEQMAEHANRNIRLLKQSLKEEPSNLRWKYHLLNEYDNIDDWGSQRSICREVLDGMDGNFYQEDEVMRGVFSAASLRIERRCENWEQEKRIYDAQIRGRSVSEVADAYIHLDMALCELNLNHREESLSHLGKYLEAYGRCKGREGELADRLSYFLNETFADNLYELALAIKKTWEMRGLKTDAAGDRKKQLSIQVLSSGRLDKIERCLSSLAQIRERIDAEIVVVDTDPNRNKKVREVVEHYADEIVDFTWINDFAAARNAGLERCSGEWFFFVDDDEWFLDPEPLIDFFESGEYEEYTTADFLIRNYLDTEKTRYNDSWVSRLVKLNKNSLFKGKVHESIFIPQGNIAAIRAIVGHDGYVFVTDEQRKEHAKRNIRLLAECVKEEPKEPHWLYQLYLEYDSIEDRSAQEELCKKALELLKKRTDSRSNAFYGFFVCGLIRIRRIFEDWENVIDDFHRYYSKSRFGKAAKAYIYMDMALALYKIGSYVEAERYAYKYLELYRKYHNHSEDLRYEALFFLEGTFSQPIYGLVVALINSMDASKGDWSSFDKYFPTIEWDDDAPYDMSGVAGVYIDLMLDTAYDDRFVRIIQAFDRNASVKDMMRCRLEQEEKDRVSGIITAIDRYEKRKDEKMDLSISLLSSGRIDTIERCLSSLMIFKEQLNAEIVIVDTDPEGREDVRAILEKYADTIIPFTWCDDFSAARNAGLLRCTGEWYMFVDDDEWFIEAQPIIDFLKSREKDKYYWADYTTRNYTSADWSTYTDAWATRLVRRTKKLRFRGRVHEYLDPLPGRPKVLEAIEGHTGYIYANAEEREAHNRRNISLLERLIKEEPDEPRWRLQLLQEYEDTATYEKKKSLCEESLKALKDKEGEGYDRSRGLFAGALIRLERLKKDWNAATQVFSEVIKEERYRDVAKAYMHLDAAQAFYYIDDFAQAEEHSRIYLKYYNRLHNKDELIHEDLMFYMQETFEPHMWGLAYNLLMYLEIKRGRFDAFERYFDKAEWSDGYLYDFRGYERKLLELVGVSKYDRHFLHMLEVFWKGTDARQVLRDWLSELGRKDAEQYWHLLEALIKAGLSDPKPYDLSILWCDHSGEACDYEAMYRGLLKNGDPFMSDSSLWRIANERHVPLSGIIDRIPFLKWRRYVDHFTWNTPIETIREISSEYDKQEDTGSDHRCYYLKNILTLILEKQADVWEAAVFKGQDALGVGEANEYRIYQEALALLERFTTEGFAFYERLYNTKSLEENSELLPDECRAAIKLRAVPGHIKKDDYRSALSVIKETIGICPELDGTLQAFSHLYSSVLSKRVSSPNSEMQQLINSLYAKVEELISQGYVNEARDIIAKINAIAPPEMKRQI